jgi:hypothetical protein
MAEFPERDTENEGERQYADDTERAAERRPPSGPPITGRSFAGTSYASNEREQTADHLGESEKFRADDTPEFEPGREDIPRDAS